uniref:Uncharacterized protein n=1 Tax=Fagus sylvatica TaxID=28930 RepID=A0A2N9GWC8_FAGSY
MEAGDNSAPPLSASERQLQALTANIQELARQSAADRREMQELAKQNQELMALLRSRGEIPSPGQGQNGEEIPRNETGRNQSQNHNQNDEGSSANQNREPHPHPHPSQVADPAKSAADARAAKLEEELKEMREQMKEMKSQTNTLFPAKFKVPQLETFDGFKDPLDYLDSFRTIMRLHGVSDEIMCRTFPTNLRGSARTWFNQLETGSIDTFAQLSRAFIDNFIGGRRSVRPANYLLNIRQREGESLRSYVQRFNKEAVQIDEPNEYVALTAFNAGLLKGDFLFQLCKDPPKSMSELMYEAQKFINAEDAFQARDEFLSRKRKEPEDRRFDSSRNKSSRQDYPKDREEEHKLDKTEVRQEPRPPRQDENKDRQEDRPRDIIGEIRTIVGGLASGGASRSSRKAYARQAHNILVTQRSRKSLKMDDQDFLTRRVLVDNGSSADIIYLPAYQQMKVDKEQLKPIDIPLTVPSAYNVIIGRPTLNKLRAVTSTYHLLVRFPTEHGIGELKGDQATARECYFASLGPEATHQTMKIDEGHKLVEPTEELEEIVLDDDEPSKTTSIGTKMDRTIRETMISFLKSNLDVFAWTHDDMPGIDPATICHKLNVDPSIRPIKQKRRVFAPDRNQAISDEANGKWRMCVDFTDLNKACPKDSFPLPRIDQLVDSTAGHRLLTFMDAFSGYNQIMMDESDQEKTCLYHKQRTLLLQSHAVRIEERWSHLPATDEQDVPPPDRTKHGGVCRRYAGENEGRHKALGGFERDVRNPPSISHEAQPEQMCLRRFVRKIPWVHGLPERNRGQPRQNKSRARDDSPKSPRQLSAQPSSGKTGAPNCQCTTPSKAFQGAEERYPAMEKLALALIIAARKLRPYFQSHKIIVLTNHPLRKAMNKPDAAGRLIQWAVELSEFDIEYHPRQAIKAQALADFIAEFTVTEDEPSEEKPDEGWEIEIDGSSVKGAGGVGIVFKTPEGHLLKHSTRLQYPTTNNEAEYEALLTGLRIAKELGANRLKIRSDSQLIVGQVNVKLVQIPREQNTEADALAKLASSDEATDQYIEVQHSPSHLEEELSPINVSNSWMTPIINYLEDETLPTDPVEARKLKVRCTRFALIQGILYKRGFSLPYLRCLDKAEADYVMREVHEGICGNHSGARSLVHKLIRAGYYWPTMQKDVVSYVRACDKCQRFGNLIHSPPETLTPMTAPWPFAQWGLDIMGPLPVGRRQLKFLVVGIDYFTKAFISDNGRQFDNSPFREFCEELGIHNHYSSPGHPQANGQVEVTNRSLLKMIKTRLEGAKGLWPEELPNILWAYRTTARTPTGETPFRLTYGTEAVIPVEVGLTTWRTNNYDEESNDAQLRSNLDLVDEIRDQVEARTRDPTQGKLGPTWEGPYRVVKFHRRGTYHLEKLDGDALPHPWNAEHLKKYYQ